MEEHTARAQLEAVLKDFEERHWQTRRVFMTRYEEIEAQLKLDGNAISDDKRQLIGAYFCHEYSYAAAALMNPSVCHIMIRAVCLKGRSGSSCPCAQWGRATSVRLPSGRASSQQRVTCVLRPNRRSQLRPTRVVKKMRGSKVPSPFSVIRMRRCRVQ